MSRYQDLASTHYENFPVGSLLLPRAQRVHMRRIYAFARTADDIADEMRDPAELASFREAFSSHLAGAGEVPMLRDLSRSIAELDLPESLFFDLLDAFAIDLDVDSHDADSLWAYCRKSADPVGRLVLRVFGYDRADFDTYSDHICTGLQLVNHLQDVAEDWRERQRIYLPVEDMERFGVSAADLEAAHASAALRALIRHWTDICSGLFRQGYPLTRLVGGRLGLELRAICGGAALVLGHLRRVDYDVLATHIRLSHLEKMRIVAGALVRRQMPPEFA